MLACDMCEGTVGTDGTTANSADQSIVHGIYHVWRTQEKIVVRDCMLIWFDEGLVVIWEGQ